MQSWEPGTISRWSSAGDVPARGALVCGRGRVRRPAGSVPAGRAGCRRGRHGRCQRQEDRAPAKRRSAPRPGDVTFADMDEIGGNPGRIIHAWHEFAEPHLRAQRPVRGVGEPISAARSADELVECQRHEELLNVAFGSGPGWTLVCPYDTAALDADVIAECRCSHPQVRENGVTEPSSEYRGLEAIWEPFAPPLPEPSAAPDELAFDLSRLGDVRRTVADAARRARPRRRPRPGSDRRRPRGGGQQRAPRRRNGLLRTWNGGAGVTCEIRDAGVHHRAARRAPAACRPGPGRERAVARQPALRSRPGALVAGRYRRSPARTSAGCPRRLNTVRAAAFRVCAGSSSDRDREKSHADTWTKKQERKYEHIRDSEREQGASPERAKEIAARTVNKERAQKGQSATASRSSTNDMSSSRRGGLRSGTARAKGRTKAQLYNEAKQRGIKGRSR